jgi:Molybdopterin oxidoreductase
VHHDPDRLRTPLRRAADGGFAPIGWDEAFDLIEQRLHAVRASGGADAIAVYMGNPIIHNYGVLLLRSSFARAVGSRNFFGPGSQDTSPRFAVSYLLYGSSLVTPVPDIDRTQYFLCVGANPWISNGSFKPHDLKQLGRELNVRYALEGSIQRAGKRMRVNVQLVDAEGGQHLWADRFDKPLADLFDMQDDIVAQLVGLLDDKVSSHAPASLASLLAGLQRGLHTQTGVVVASLPPCREIVAQEPRQPHSGTDRFPTNGRLLLRPALSGRLCASLLGQAKKMLLRAKGRRAYKFLAPETGDQTHFPVSRLQRGQHFRWSSSDVRRRPVAEASMLVSRGALCRAVVRARAAPHGPANGRRPTGPCASRGATLARTYSGYWRYPKWRPCLRGPPLVCWADG